MIYFRNFVLDNQSLAAGTQKIFKVPAEYSTEYSRGAFNISIVNASSGGSGSSSCFFYQAEYVDGAAGVNVGVRNTGTSNAKIKIVARVEYIKNEILLVE